MHREFKKTMPNPMPAEEHEDRYQLKIGKKTQGFKAQLIAVFIFLLAGAAIAGYFYYSGQERLLLSLKVKELASVSDLKMREIEAWRTERLSNASFMLETHAIMQKLVDFANAQDSSGLRKDALNILSSLKEKYDYEIAAIVSVRGTPKSLLSFPEGHWEPEASILESMSAAVEAKKILVSDIHRTDYNRSIRMTILVPLVDYQASGIGIPLVLVLEINPERFLFPLIESWPTASSSGESLLVRREGNDVLFLNELRHRKHTALMLRFPVNEKVTMPAVLAARGFEGAFEGADYRGVPVLSYIRAIPESPWFLVAKEDKDEIYSPLRSTLFTVILSGSLFAIASLLLVLLFWTRQRSRYEKVQEELESDKLIVMRNYDLLRKHANDIILLFDGSFNILDANDRAMDAYGYSRAELLSMNQKDLYAPGLPADNTMHKNSLVDSGSTLFESEQLRKNGSSFPVEVSAWSIRIEEKIYFQEIVRDITERKHAEAALRERERYLRRFFESGLVGVIYWTTDGRITNANDKFLEMTGYTRADLETAGIDWISMTPQEYRSLDEASMKELLATGVNKIPFEKEYIRKDGARLPVIIAGAMVDEERRNGVAFVLDIGERKHMEEELRKSEERYRGLFENMIEGYAYCRMLFENGSPADFIYIEVNNAFGVITKLADVKGKKVSEVIPEIRKTNPELFDIYGRVSITGEPEKLETYVEPLGIWFSISVYSPEQYYFVAIFDDITERKHTEESLRKSEARYRDTLETMMEGCQIIGKDLRYIYVNQTAANHGRKKREELTGRLMTEAYPGIERTPMFEALETCMTHRISKKLANRFSYIDGTYGWFELSIHPVPEGIFILSVDITERKKAEEILASHREHLEELVRARTSELERLNVHLVKEISVRTRAEESLAKSNAYNRALVETSIDPFVLIDLSGRMTDINAAAEHVTGNLRSDLVGTGFAELFTEPLAAKEFHNLALADGIVKNRELEIKNQTGSALPSIWNASVIYNEKNEAAAVCAWGRDISDRKRAENILRKSNTELEMRVTERTAELALKNHELEQIIYVASHDLRSPLVNVQGFGKELSFALTNLISYCKEAAQEGKLSEKILGIDNEIREDLQFIDSGILKMDTLLSGLLRISRLGSAGINKQKIDMNKLVAEVVSALEFQVKSSGATITISALPSCFGDKAQIGQVFSNLVDSIKYLDPGRPGTIGITGSSNSDQSEYCVEDNGIGIAPEHREKIFEIFHRLNPTATKGEGLGLSIVKRILDKHGGTIRTESEKGKGSKFIISVPHEEKKETQS
jgi:PAS domain S-box-containing protein